MLPVISKSYGQPHRSVHVEFVVDTAAFGNVLPQVQFSQQYHTTSAPTLFYHLLPEAK